MFDRLQRSFSLAKSSFALLRSDKQLLLFPVFSGISTLLVLLVFALPFVMFPDLLKGLDAPQNAPGQPDELHVPLWAYPALFAFYFVNYFVIIFFNSGLISCAIMRFNGQQATVGDGLSMAWARLPQIAAWALVAATVGFLLKMIENAHEQAGRFVSAILGTAWSVVTYFVVPVLVVEKVGPIDAVKRSLAILKQAWGEALIGNSGIGLVMFVLLLPALLVGFVGAMLVNVMLPVGVALIVLAALYVLVWMAVGPTVNGIYVAALYQYASSQIVPQGFNGADLAGAFSRK